MTHPIWAVMRDEGRSLRWLSNRTGYCYALVRGVKYGTHRASDTFRARCATALGRRESELFIPEPERQEVRV